MSFDDSEEEDSLARGCVCPHCHVFLSSGNLRRHLLKKCPRVRDGSAPKLVDVAQREAKVNGQRWITRTCAQCKAPIHIHVDWEHPLELCKPCKERRRSALRQKHAEHYAARIFSPRGPSEGTPVRGGLPSLGKRR